MINRPVFLLKIFIVFTIQFTFTGCDILESLFANKENSSNSKRANVVLSAVADTFVRSNAKTKNFGSLKALKVKKNSRATVQSLVKFSVPSLPGKITKVKLKMHVKDGTNNGVKIYKTSSTWAEKKVNWNSRPDATGSQLSDLGRTEKGWVEINVTQAVSGPGKVSFILIPDSSDLCVFNSKETDKPPKLLITTDDDNPGGDNSGCNVENPDALGDGHCDQNGGYNTAVCGYDGGDCCEESCVPSTYNCPASQFYCIDPNYQDSDDDNNNNNSGKFTVTSVNDNLDNSDGQDFINGFKELGYTLNKWNKDVSTSELKNYLQTNQEMVYHTGHGNTGIIATSSGTLNTNNLTIQSKYFISATCLTLADTSWKNTFGSTAQVVMGYTKVSYDKPTDNNQVVKYIKELKNGNSHLISWYKSNIAISSLKDRWAAYARENSKIVEYSARTGNTPRSTSGDIPVVLFDRITADSSLLNNPTRFDRSYQVAVVDEISTALARAKFRSTWPTSPASLTNTRVETIANNQLANYGGKPSTARLESINSIERCNENGNCYTVAYQVYYVQQYNNLDLRSNIVSDYISLLIDETGVISMDVSWSQVTPLEVNPSAYNLLDIGSALNIAGPDIWQLVRGNAVHIVAYDTVYGISTRDDGEKTLVPAYEFLGSDGERFVVNAVTGKLVF